MSAYILEMKNITKTFPGVIALNNVSLQVKRGEIHALVGENGAGKSTLMKVLNGVYQADSGEILIDGQTVKIRNTTDAERLGIGLVFQECNLVNSLSVSENMFLNKLNGGRGLVNWKQINATTQEFLDSLCFDFRATAKIEALSASQKQMVEIIKAVSINAKIIIMDEPTSSLSGKETESLFKIIRKLKSRGVAIVFITHRLDEIFEICDRMTVLRDGCYIGERNICDITKDEMIAMMIGRKLTQQYPERSNPIGEVTLEVKNIIDHNSRVKGISFQAHRGEVLGFYGLVGAGRTETMRMIFGVDPVVGGEIYIHGKQRRIRSPRDAIAAGMGFVTENRRDEGLFLRSSIRVNTVMVALPKILKKGFISYKEEARVAQKYVERLHTATPSINQKTMFLSGGNQQKVVLAKWLYSDSDIIIFDEPTRGIDVGARREIYEIINNLVENGKTVVVISSDMEEIMGVSDRILVMYEGTIAGEIQKKDFTQDLITKYAVGEKRSVQA